MKQLFDYIEIIRIVDINKLLFDSRGHVTTVELLPGRKIFCIDTDKEFKITSKVTNKDNNIQYEHDLKAVAELSDIDIHNLNKCRVIVSITDSKKKYYIGNLNQPATVTLLPNLNTCEINVSCNSLLPIF